MSRSFRKVIGYVDRNPFMKRKANEKVRNIKYDETPKNGNSYKKEFCSWDICDWTWLYYTESSFKSYVEECNDPEQHDFEKFYKKQKHKLLSK